MRQENLILVQQRNKIFDNIFNSLRKRRLLFQSAKERDEEFRQIDFLCRQISAATDRTLDTTENSAQYNHELAIANFIQLTLEYYLNHALNYDKAKELMTETLALARIFRDQKSSLADQANAIDNLYKQISSVEINPSLKQKVFIAVIVIAVAISVFSISAALVGAFFIGPISFSPLLLFFKGASTGVGIGLGAVITGVSGNAVRKIGFWSASSLNKARMQKGVSALSEIHKDIQKFNQ